MFIPFFLKLRQAKVPVTLREFLSLLEGMEEGIADYDVEAFYYLARTTLIKDERFIDRFDQVFADYFRGVEAIGGNAEGRWSKRQPFLRNGCASSRNGI